MVAACLKELKEKGNRVQRICIFTANSKEGTQSILPEMFATMGHGQENGV